MHKGPRKDPKEAKRWLKQAEDDYIVLCALVAELNTRSAKLPAYLCFMAHQVTEKALKGGMYALCGLGEKSLKSNNLMQLAYALEGASTDLREGDLAQFVGPLETYYLDTRYPNRHPPYTIPTDVYTLDQARQAKEAADIILDLVKNVVNWSRSS